LSFLAEYGLFLAQVITIVLAIIVVIGSIIALGAKNKKSTEGHIEITNITENLLEIKEGLLEEILSEDDYKKLQKEKKEQEKSEKKEHKQQSKKEKQQIKKQKKEKKKEIQSVTALKSSSETTLSKKSSSEEKNSSEFLNIKETSEKSSNDSTTIKEKSVIFVLRFDGDVEASAVELLREEITAIISIAKPNDEVVLCLESPGGMVHAYGLAASQLTRIKNANLHLTIIVDQVAASGGYMMACVGNKILAAPFAIIGSIGVVAEIPNFHRLLKHNKVDYEQHTAGEFKRTLTMFSENTDLARTKFKQELEETHELFKHFILENRPELSIDKVATGEHWYGSQALTLGLIDGIMTSDEYIVHAAQEQSVFEINYQVKKSLAERFSFSIQSSIEKAFLSVWKKSIESQLFK
jgi:serine protease SohB